MKKIKVLLYLALFYGLMSCSTLKSAQQHEKKESVQYISGEQESKWFAQRTVHLQNTDSIGNHYQTEIWPEGIFQLNPQTGFTGKAKKIKQRGAYQAAHRFESTETAQEDAVEQKRSTRNSLKKETRSVKFSDTLYPIWGWIFAGLVLGVLYVWYRKPHPVR